jgi:glyoxylase-like metal-dependent hydrolase (beta-lactamase superfamily II)
MTNFRLITTNGNTFLFTGDGIFIHSIGRPDLMGKGEPWAEMLYDSLTTRLAETLAKNPIILPAHFQYFSEQNGEGLFNRDYEQLKVENPYLRPMERREFVKLILADIPEAPEEYLEILRINHAFLDVSDDVAQTLEAGKNLCSATILEH